MHSSQAKPDNVLHQANISSGLYLHVPFCASTCDFCAFYQEAPRRPDLLRYLDGIERELDQWLAEWESASRYNANGEFLPGLDAELTVFFGGGTPGLLATEDLRRLCEAVQQRTPVPIREWSVEMAPSTVKADKVAAMLEAGVNRISMGVQSFDETLLDNLGRRHSPSQVLRAYEILRESGCENINLDLIFAVPGQTKAQWTEDMRRAIELDPEHISTYCLTFEEDTKLWVKLTRGELRRDIELEAELYQYTWETLEAAGYAQYEVSNFARPGRECAHNLSTWHMGAWRGVGPSAASQWQGRRWANAADLNVWLEGLKTPQVPSPSAMDVVELSANLLASDALIFGLRLNEGVDLSALQDRFPDADWPQFEALWAQLIDEGALVRTDNLLKLTGHGRMLVDAIGGRILEIEV